MARFRNRKAQKFTESLPTTGIENSGIQSKCKFNFSYFTTDQVGQSFDDWAPNMHGASSLATLLGKLQQFSHESLGHWKEQRVGGGSGKILEVYGAFPKTKSHFTHPKSVPHDALWGRFRLSGRARLVGFILPEKFNHKTSSGCNEQFVFCCNTFYIVFLDKDHKFYDTSK